MVLLPDDLIFVHSILKLSVEIVELNLYKLEYTLVLCKEIIDSVGSAVGRESKVSYLALFPHLFEILNNTKLLVCVEVIGGLANIMEKIKVEMIYLALLQLLIKISAGVLQWKLER